MRSVFDMSLRGRIAFVHDVMMAAISFALSLYLRVGNDVFEFVPAAELAQGTLLFAAVAAGVFLFMGLYRGVWRYASLRDLMAITRSVTLVVLIFFLVMFLWTRLEDIPRSVPLINWFVLMALLGGPRFALRLMKDRPAGPSVDDENHRSVPVLLAGADDGAELFLRALARTHAAPYRAVGILAEDRGSVGGRIHGVEVMGTVEDAPAVVERLRRSGDPPQRLIVTNDRMDGAAVRRLLEAANHLGLGLARLPRITDLKSGVTDKLEVRPVAVEDLLRRPQSALDRQAMRAFIKGRRVLITGAGGSIGSELVRQVAGLEPAEIVLLDQCEFNLYTIDMEMATTRGDLRRRSVLADVRDKGRIDRVFAEVRPEVVFHAAALKHVPLVEANVFEGIRTNVAGTANIAGACVAHGVQVMVMVSTDKAVNPTNVMGATKRVAESYCQALDLRSASEDGTRFITVRFGNVLGSTGSVVPLFQRQIAKGGPVTVTHPEMTRYFMTIREAVELVLEASALGSRQHGHEGKIFVLDMGEPVKILDLARQMIRLAGLRPGEDIAIEIIGLRPGEKLAEEIFHGEEALVESPNPGILLASPRVPDASDHFARIERLVQAAERGDQEEVRAILLELVPEFRPDTGPGGRAGSEILEMRT